MLLPIALRRSSASAGVKPRDVLGGLHRLLLVETTIPYACSVIGEEPLVRIGDLLDPRLAARVDQDVLVGRAR